MCHCLNTPISLPHFSCTLLEHDSISKYYEKSHTHTNCIHITSKCQKQLPTSTQNNSVPSCSRTSCNSHLYPWINRAWPFSPDRWGTYISRVLFSRVSALLLPTFNRTSALCKHESWNGSYSLHQHRYLRNPSSACVVKLRSVSDAQN